VHLSLMLVECKHFLEVIHWEKGVGDRHALHDHSLNVVVLP